MRGQCTIFWLAVTCRALAFLQEEGEAGDSSPPQAPPGLSSRRRAAAPLPEAVRIAMGLPPDETASEQEEGTQVGDTAFVQMPRPYHSRIERRGPCFLFSVVP